MEVRISEPTYEAPSIRTFNASSGVSAFNLLSPNGSLNSIQRLQRKPDIYRTEKSSRSKKESLGSIFAGFYSPNHFGKTTSETTSLFMNSTMRESNNQPKKEKLMQQIQASKEALADLTMRLQSNTTRKSSIKLQQSKTYRRITDENCEIVSGQSVVSKNKKLEEDLAKCLSVCQQHQQKVSSLSIQVKDLQRRLQGREADIKQYQLRQKATLDDLTKLRQQNILLEEKTRKQLSELDLYDRKYIQVQIQVREMRRSKDVFKKDQAQFVEKITALQQIVKEKDQQLYKVVAQNDRMNCQMWTKQQRIHQMQNDLDYKKDAILESTNKRLRTINKELMHRVNSLLSCSKDFSDVSFELSPQR